MTRNGIVVALTLLAVCLPARAFDTPEEAQSWYDREVDRRGALHWSLLAELDVEAETVGPLRTVFRVRFPEAVRALHEREVTVLGFIYVLEPGREQTRFLLSALPPGCPFCLPGGPTSLIDVRCSEPVRFTKEPIALRGRFELLEDDETGLYYRLSDASAAD